MAIKPTIYKFTIALSDMDRHVYESLALTVARHPSETMERMLVRVLAFSINATDGLEFGAGLSTADQPDLLARAANGTLSAWIDVGEPSLERLKLGSRSADLTRVYSFNTKSDTWWQQIADKARLMKVEVFRFEWDEIQELAGMIERTNTMSISISDQSAYVATRQGECEIGWRQLQ